MSRTETSYPEKQAEPTPAYSRAKVELKFTELLDILLDARPDLFRADDAIEFIWDDGHDEDRTITFRMLDVPEPGKNLSKAD